MDGLDWDCWKEPKKVDKVESVESGEKSTLVSKAEDIILVSEGVNFSIVATTGYSLILSLCSVEIINLKMQFLRYSIFIDVDVLDCNVLFLSE